MITTLDSEQKIVLGARHRGEKLVAQAGYTLGLAEETGPELLDLLEPGFLAEVRRLMGEVEAALAEKINAEAESRDATLAQNQALREAKIVRRKLAARGRRYRRMGREVPAALCEINRSSTVTPVLKQLNEMLDLARKYASQLGPGVERLIDEGEQAYRKLAQADAEQEKKRLADLPRKVREYYATKGTLYTALKIINEAAQELYADNPAEAARYNLKILYRRHGQKNPQEIKH